MKLLLKYRNWLRSKVLIANFEQIQIILVLL